MRDEMNMGRTTRRLLLVAALLTIAGGHFGSGARAQTPAPPAFTIEMLPVDSTNLPAVQSFAWAQYGGKWLIIGGRTQGLHLFVESSNGGNTAPPNAFPPAQANTSAWVIDPVLKKAWSSPLSKLPTTCAGGQATYNCADPLSSTNQEFLQDGNTLYIIGGYGLDSKTNQMTTFPTVSAIKVQETISAIVGGQPIDPYIQQTSTYYDCQQATANFYSSCVSKAQQNCKQGPGYSQCVKNAQTTCRQKQSGAQASCIQQVQSGNTQGIPTNTGYYARVTGGDLEKVGNIFYLVFGQRFEGLYSTLEGDYGKWPTQQVYTSRITALNLTPDPLTASVLNVIQDDPNNLQSQYHRRDLNVLATLSPQGKERITAYGGVFVPGRNSAYRQPVFIDNGADPLGVKVTVNNYQQFMSQYDCAAVTMFDRSRSNLITIFFGGISLYYLDQKLNQIKEDEGLPFIDDVTAMTSYSDGSWSEFVRAAPMDGYLGTDAKFIPNSSLPAASNGVIYFDTIQGRTVLGYFYGGIRAERSEAGDPTGKFSHATNALYQIVLTPTGATSNYWVPANPKDPSQIPKSDKGGVNTRRKSQD